MYPYGQICTVVKVEKVVEGGRDTLAEVLPLLKALANRVVTVQHDNQPVNAKVQHHVKADEFRCFLLLAFVAFRSIVRFPSVGFMHHSTYHVLT